MFVRDLADVIFQDHTCLLSPALLYHCPEKDLRPAAAAKAGGNLLSGRGNRAFCGGKGFQL